MKLGKLALFAVAAIATSFMTIDFAEAKGGGGHHRPGRPGWHRPDHGRHDHGRPGWGRPDRPGRPDWGRPGHGRPGRPGWGGRH